MKGNNLERFWSKVDKTENCWNWTAGKFWNGYGQFWLNGKVVKAHRFSYELNNGEIGENLVIDHLCRNRACVNPQHLEAIADKENILRGEGSHALNGRKTHCTNGHEFTPDNTGFDKKAEGIAELAGEFDLQNNIEKRLKMWLKQIQSMLFKFVWQDRRYYLFFRGGLGCSFFECASNPFFCASEKSNVLIQLLKSRFTHSEVFASIFIR